MTSRWKRCRQVQWISSQSAAKRRDEGAPAEFNLAWHSRAQAQRSRRASGERSRGRHARARGGDHPAARARGRIPRQLRVARHSRIMAGQIGLPAGSASTSISPRRCTTSARLPFPTISCSARPAYRRRDGGDIRTHATIGEEILADSSCELIQLGAQIAAGHHERWDGAGYPMSPRGWSRSPTSSTP
jgi:hypothetical protein